MLFTPRTLTKHCAAILDLDGTIADNTHRQHLLPQEKDWHLTGKEMDMMWKRFHAGLDQDGFSQHVYDVFQYYCGKFPTIRRVVVSGRNESNRPAIIKWLNKHNVDIDEMYLRPDGDFRPNSEIKVEIVNRLRADNINTVFAFEDEILTCQALKDAKVQVYKVTLPNTIERF